jgi:ketopantoate reductase
MLTPTAATARNWRASMAQDIAKGRRTEIGEMNGHVMAEGGRTGIPTPVSAAIVAAVREVELGTRAQSPRNLELVLRQAGDAASGGRAVGSAH